MDHFMNEGTWMMGKVGYGNLRTLRKKFEPSSSDLFAFWYLALDLREVRLCRTAITGPESFFF